jgi:ssDNA-binding Zn-finger/Zn-ribbon topoisomerase 1
MSINLKRKPTPVCPECGAPMALRANRKTNDPFWGCSRFPECKGVLGIGPPRRHRRYSFYDDGDEQGRAASYGIDSIHDLIDL